MDENKIAAILTELCGTEIQPDTELMESGLLDSLAFIELLEALEDEGIEIQPTQVERSRFATARSIAEVCGEM